MNNVVGSNPTSSVIVYTDGACFGNPGNGGYGFVLIKDNFIIKYSQGEEATTNNRMEVRSMLEAWTRISCFQNATIFTDSIYLAKGYNEWMHKWVKNNWKNSSNSPVQNIDLWLMVYENWTIHRGEFTVHWVPAHSNNYYNDLADKLAKKNVEKHIIKNNKE